MEREEQKIMMHRNDVRKVGCLCHKIGCINDSIRSHVLWKSGIINNMSGTNDVMELLFHLVGRKYKFNKVKSGPSDTLTFWGFCTSCDNEIFSPIEYNDANYGEYENQLLMSYRGLVNEIYKIEYNLKWYDKIFSDQSISVKSKNSYFRKMGLFLQVIDLHYKSKELLEIEIFGLSNNENFIFSYREISKLDICSCACYQMIENLPITNTDDFFNSYVFFNLFPNGDKTILLVGVYSGLKDNDALIKYLDNANEFELLKYISDTLIKHVETWIVSVDLYQKWKSKNFDKLILEKKEEFLPFEKKNEEIEFNIFG